jgi:putative adhesin
MSVAYPPEAPVSPPTREPPAPAAPPNTPAAPKAPTEDPVAPPAPPYTPPTPEALAEEPFVPPPVRRPQRGGVVGGLILIAVGVVVLFGSWFPGRGAWLFLGLGVAFLVARVMTGRPGYAVPAGILLGFGSFIWFTETGMLSGSAAGGTFFIFLGLGFLAAYAIAARPASAWPVFPGVALIGFGVFIQAATLGAPLGQFWWVADYWPLALVLVGGWLLVRNRVPESARTPVALIGASALVLIGLFVAAAGMATVSSGYSGSPMPMFRGWPAFGQPTLQDTITLTAPVSGIDSVRLVNTSGYTIVRATDASDIRVQATRHFWISNNAPDVRLVPGNGVMTIEATPVVFGPGEMASYIDYTIDVPAGLGANVRSASGSVNLQGLAGAVNLNSASGNIDAHDLGGTLSARTSSGAIRVSNVTGDAQLSTISGSILAVGVDRLTEARTTSGDVNLNVAFTRQVQISSTSGEVIVRVPPAPAFNVDASSFSGDVSSDLALTNRTVGPHNLAGAVGRGGPTVSIHTTSGTIRLISGG